MTVALSGEARLDLVNILEHFDEPGAALERLDRIEHVISLLDEQPLLGHAGRSPGTLELVVDGTPHIVVYEVHGRDVEVLRVLHGRNVLAPPR